MNNPEKENKTRSLFSFCAFHFLDDGFTDSIYILLPFIAAELSLSFSQVGLLKGVFSGAMGVLQVPLSLLGEKIGELTVIAAGMVGLATGFILLSQVTTFLAVFLSLIFSKGTAAGQHGLGSSILSRVFEMSGRRTAMGIYNFSGDIGKVCIPFLLTVMITLSGWRQALFNLAIGGFAAVTVLWILARREKDSPQIQESYRGEALAQEGGGWGIRGWGIQDKKRFLSLLAIGIIDMSARTALLTFLPFLFVQKGIAMTEVGFALTLLFAGGAAGKFVCGVLAERFGTVPMVIGTEVLTAAGILSLTWFPPSVIWVLLPLVGIVLNGTSSVLYATVAEIIPPHARSRGYGLYYAITLGSGAVSPIAYGMLVDFLGLSFTILCTALMVLMTLPLSRYLSRVDSQ